MAHRITVGGRIGSLNAFLPFGAIRISSAQLTVSLPFTKVSFAPEEVVSLEQSRPFPYLMTHVRVNHT